MALEIKEIVIRALVGQSGCDDKDKKKNPCESNKETEETQDTVDMVSEMMKNEKER